MDDAAVDRRAAGVDRQERVGELVGTLAHHGEEVGWELEPERLWNQLIAGDSWTS
jgi:hypothetical protein